MVDLFAVLALVFMIHSTDEIAIAIETAENQIAERVEEESAETIDALLASEAKIRELELKLEENVSQQAKYADLSLEELLKQREAKTQELARQIAERLVLEDTRAALDYRGLVQAIEYKHDEELEQQEATLKQAQEQELAKQEAILAAEKQRTLEELALQHQEAVATTMDELAQDKARALSEEKQRSLKALARQAAELQEAKDRALVLAQREHEKDLASTVEQLNEGKLEAMAAAKHATLEALTAQQASLQKLRDQELTQARAGAASIEEQLEMAQEALGSAHQDREQALSALKSAKDEFAEALAAKEAEAARERRRALAQAAQAHDAELAAQASAMEARAAAQLAQASAAFAETLEAKESGLEAEKARALAMARQAHEDELARQNAALEREKARKLREAEGEFAAALAAKEEELERERELAAEIKKQLAEAKQRIVEQLAHNFRDVFDDSAVEIDEKTGRVKLNFQGSYFLRGSSQLSEDMKEFLRAVIPRYAKSIYENPEAAKHIESLKISGMTSPVYLGRYVDINDTSPATARARQFNMSLSEKRALAMYNFIFDENEMGDYEYRERMKTDMSIAAVGYQNAKPVPSELVGKIANCEEYDCRQEQATILQFYVYSEE